MPIGEGRGVDRVRMGREAALVVDESLLKWMDRKRS